MSRREKSVEYSPGISLRTDMTSYGDYLWLQSTKMRKRAKEMRKTERAHQGKFRIHFGILKGETDGTRLLCLGARHGTEAAVAESMGFDPVAMDLLPGREARKTVQADFHFLPFKADSFDCMYTNSMDHSLRPDLMNEEMKRVLRPGGTGLVLGHYDTGPYGVLRWKKTKPLIGMLKRWWSHVDEKRDQIIIVRDETKT